LNVRAARDELPIVISSMVRNLLFLAYTANSSALRFSE
jgi:hypothetical protein